MKNLKILLLFIAVTLGVTSCKKDSPDPAAAKPDTQAQIDAKAKIAGKWYIKKAEYIYKADGKVDAYSHYDNTQFYEFKTDGALVISFERKQGTDFTYKFSEDASTLSLFNPNPNDVYKVKTLTATSLTLEKEHTIAPAMTEIITLSK